MGTLPVKVKKKPGPPAVGQQKLDAYGLDQICADLSEGQTLTAICQRVGVDIATLFVWIERDPQKLARTREARTRSAKLWDERAEMVIAMAQDPFELAKARELAHHYRWRAKAIAPRDYGEKVTQEHTGKDGGPITMAAVDLKGLSDAELEQMQTLLGKAVPPALE